MSHLHRFIFLIVLLVLASALIYGFDTTRAKKSPKLSPTPSVAYTSQTPKPTIMAISDPAHWDGYESRDISIEGKEYHLLLADTPQRQELGLMYITALQGYDGMIFPFDDVSPKSFWNQNTIVDLQIYWLNDATVVGKEILPSIYKTGSPKTITSPGPVNTVVELMMPKTL